MSHLTPPNPLRRQLDPPEPPQQSQRQSRSPRASHSRRPAAEDGKSRGEYQPPDDLRLPDADSVFPEIPISSADLDSLSTNTVFRRLVCDIHKRQYQLRADALRATDMAGLAECRGRTEELDRLLGTLHSYLTGDGDAHGEGEGDDESEGDMFNVTLVDA